MVQNVGALFEQCGTEPMATILMRKRWRWIGHVTRQEASIAKTALHWTPEGRGNGQWRKKSRTWGRSGEPSTYGYLSVCLSVCPSVGLSVSHS